MKINHNKYGERRHRQRPEFLLKEEEEEEEKNMGTPPLPKSVLRSRLKNQMTPSSSKNIRIKERSKSSPDMSKKSKYILRRGLRFSTGAKNNDGKEVMRKLAVVLDLDETLVHSRFVNKEDGSIRQRERRKSATVATNEFVLNIGGETIHVNRRPGLDKFLAEASKHFDLYVKRRSEDD